MELKKAAAIAGVATLGYIGYALVTAPTPKISRAEGVCSCGTECVCECGCAESGVCNCGPSCPCDCGCGWRKPHPSVFPSDAESFEATNKSWIVKEYPHTISESQHKEVMDALDYYEENFRVKLYVRYGDTIRILTTTIPIPDPRRILPTFSAESFGAEAQAVIIKGKNRRGLPEDRAHIIGQMEKDDFTPTTIINTDTGNMEGIGRIPLGDKFANHHKFAESYSAERGYVGNCVDCGQYTQTICDSCGGLCCCGVGSSHERADVKLLWDDSDNICEECFTDTFQEMQAESFAAEGDWELDYHSGSYHGIKHRSYDGVKYIRQGNLLKCECGYEQKCYYPFGCYSCGPKAHRGKGHIVGFTPNGRIVWKDECTGKFQVDTDGETDIDWFKNLSRHSQCKKAESHSAEGLFCPSCKDNTRMDEDEEWCHLCEASYEAESKCDDGCAYELGYVGSGADFGSAYERNWNIHIYCPFCGTTLDFKAIPQDITGSHTLATNYFGQCSECGEDALQTAYRPFSCLKCGHRKDAESFSAEECNHCGNVMATSPCCGISHCPVQDFDCDCEKHYDPTGHDYPDLDEETGERYGNWEWSGDYWYQPKDAESFSAELKKDSCCCGATKSKPCACMIQGVIDCNATCPCSLEKKVRIIRYLKTSGTCAMCEEDVSGGPRYMRYSKQTDEPMILCENCVRMVSDIRNRGLLGKDGKTFAEIFDAESFSEAGLELRNAGRCGCHQDDVWKVVNVESPVFLCGTCGYAGNKKEDGHFRNMKDIWNAESFAAPVRKYEKTALHIHNFDAFKRQSDLLSEETKRLYRLIDTSKSIDESEAIKRAITEVYNAIDILHGGYWDYGAESLAAEHPSGEGKLTVSGHDFADGSLMVGVGTEDLGVDDPDFVEMMIDKDGQIDYFSLPIGEDGWDRTYNIKPSHYGKIQTIQSTNKTPGGDFDRFYAESFPPQSPCYFQCGREADIRRKLGPHHLDAEVLVCGTCSIAYNVDPHLHSWKPFGAESFSAEEIWVKNAEGNFLGPISEAEWSYLKHETEDVWEGEAITETALWDEEDDGADEDAIAHYTANFNNENYLAEYMAEPRKGGKSRFMDPKQVIDLFKKANGTLVSVTFVKRTNGEIRKMLARTSVRKGVKGVGLKFKPSDKNLMGVYDFGEVRKGADPWKCYRFVPVDAVLSLRVRGKTYTA